MAALSSSASASVVTTGLDVAAETRSFNEQLMSRMAGQPALYQAKDPAAAIQALRAGSFSGQPAVRRDPGRGRPALHQAKDPAAAIEALRAGSFSGQPPVRLDQASDRTVSSPAGPVGVRV